MAISPGESHCTHSSKIFSRLKYLTVSILPLLLLACNGDGIISVSDLQPKLAPGIGFSSTNLSTSEDGTEDSISVSLTAPPSSDVKITLTSRDVTEGLIGSDSDVDWDFNYFDQSVDLTFTPSDWSVPKVVRIQGQADSLLDGNQTYSIATTWVWSMDLNYIGIAKPTASVTNIDTSTAGITLTETALTTSEDGTGMGFYVELSVEPTADVTVPVTITDASEGSFDYYTDVVQQTLTFTPLNWQYGQWVGVSSRDDVSADGNVTYDITFGPLVSNDSSYDGLVPNPLPVTNIDNDTAAYTVSSAPTLVTNEWGQDASFTVVLNTEPTADVTIPVSSLDTSEGLVSSATSTPATSLDLLFTPSNWQTPQTVTVHAVDDAVQDGDISYNISVGAPTGAFEFTALAAQSVAMVNIDDDTAKVHLQGNDLQTSEDGGSGNFVVSLAKAPVDTVVLNVTSGDTTEGRVKGGNSPSVAADSIILTFTTADWQTAQTVTVVGQDDLVIDGAKAFNVTVAIDQALTLDVDYDALSAQTVSASNADNDVAGLTVNGSYLYVYESGTTDSLTIKLNTQPSADVTVPVSVTDATEALISSGASGDVASLNLVFTSTNWSTPQTVTAKAVDDLIDEPYSESQSLIIGPATSADVNYEGLASITKTINVYDNDSAGLVIVPTGTLTTGEDGTSASFTVALATQPTASVFVAVSSGNIAEGLLTGASSPSTPIDVVTLEFTTANWQSGQTVTVHGQDDALLDGPISHTISVDTVDGTDSYYNGVTTAKVLVNNNDNEVGVSESGVALTQASLPYTGEVAPALSSSYNLSGLSAGWKYTLTIGSVTDDISLAIKDSTGTTTLCSSNASGTKADESCAFTVPSDGTGTVGIIIDGTSTLSGAQYQFQALPLPTIATTFETFSESWSDIALYSAEILTNPSVYWLRARTSFSSGGSTTVTYDLVAGDTYYLRVQPYLTTTIGAYKVQVTQGAVSLADVGTAIGTEGEPDNDAASATALALDTPLQRYLTDSDADWFKYTTSMP